MFDRDLDCLVDPASNDIAALPVWSVRPDGLGAALAALPDQAAFVRAGGFAAAPGQLALLPGEGGLAGALLGLGDDRTPFAHGGLAAALPERASARLMPGDFDMDAAVLGFCLGAYQYTAHASPRRSMAKLLAPEGADAARSAARATWMVRDLINTPANHLGPAELAGATLALGERFGAAGQIVDGERLAAEYPTRLLSGSGVVDVGQQF